MKIVIRASLLFLASAAVLLACRPGLRARALSALRPLRAEKAVEPRPRRLEPVADNTFAVPGMDCLVDRHGIRIKVVPVTRGVRCRAAPGEGEIAGAPLRYFRPYFVFDVAPREGVPEHMLVGETPKRDGARGWAPASGLARWPTRVGVRYRRSPDGRTPPLLVFRSREDATRFVRDGLTGVEPIARTTHRAPRARMPWPVTEVAQVEARGRVHEIVKLQFLGTDGLPQPGSAGAGDSDAPGPAADEVEDVRRRLGTVDLVFVADNTRSTRPFLRAIKQAVAHIAESIAGRPSLDVRFGLVLYRDHVPGILYPGGKAVRHFALEADIDDFLELVEGLREPARASMDWPEAGYDGLHRALHATAWRGDRLSSRVVCLVGDNSFHEPGHARNPHGRGAAEIIAAARGRHVRIVGLCIRGGGGDAEQVRHARQFAALARGTGGRVFPIDDAAKAARHLLATLDDATRTASERAIVYGDLAAGKSTETIARERRLDIGRVTEVMRFLDARGVQVGPRQADGTRFAEGWAVCDVDGVPLIEREGYLARSALDLLVSSLSYVCSRLSPDGARRRFESAASSRINPAASFLAQDLPEPLDVFLMAKGIPVGRASILRLTAADIRHMPEEERARKRTRIAGTIIPGLVACRNDSSLWVYRDGLEFGWIPERLLP